MKPESHPVYLAIVMALICILWRCFGSTYLGIVNISPLMAVAFIGAMYLPRAWGWLVVPATLVLTEAAFLRVNYLTDGSGQTFWWWTVVSVLLYAALYAAATVWGRYIHKHRTLAFVAAGSVVSSLVFYVAANTISWGYDLMVHLPNGYAPTFAGWLQSNTTGIPGNPPSYLFLRNAVIGDLSFGFVLLLVVDRAFLFGQHAVKPAARAA